jgi:hypothetical protein
MPLSGRADALYVVNDARGSFLLRANEVIDQVPMSACGISDMAELSLHVCYRGHSGLWQIVRRQIYGFAA